MPPSFDGKIEKSFARAKKWERKKNMELMMSGFNSIFWHRTDFPGSFFKSEQFRTFFFSSLQQNGVKIISEGTYDFWKYFSSRIISRTFITYTGYHFIEVQRFSKNSRCIICWVKLSKSNLQLTDNLIWLWVDFETALNQMTCKDGRKLKKCPIKTPKLFHPIAVFS